LAQRAILERRPRFARHLGAMKRSASARIVATLKSTCMGYSSVSQGRYRFRGGATP